MYYVLGVTSKAQLKHINIGLFLASRNSVGHYIPRAKGDEQGL